MIQLPQLQESLLLANDRLVDRARRRARRFRLGLMTSAAVVSVGGAAVAGTALWGPVLGFEDGNRPTVSPTPAPAAQQAVLGVLARDQTPADRGAVAREALATLSREYVGIRTASVRVLLQEAAGPALVLVPVARLEAVAPGTPPAAVDAACLYARAAPRSSAVSCFGTGEVAAGRATGSVDDLVWGVVPDGVAAVAVSTRAGGTETRPVTANAFSFRTGAVDPDRRTVQWLDAQGGEVTPTGGAPMTLEFDATAG